MVRNRLRAPSRSALGSSDSASASNACFASRLAANSSSRALNASERAVKNASCAALNRDQSSSSASRPARPAAFHSVISSLKRRAGGPPSGRAGELLRLQHQALLTLRGLLALTVEVREVCPPAVVELPTRGRQPFPELGVGL